MKTTLAARIVATMGLAVGLAACSSDEETPGSGILVDFAVSADEELVAPATVSFTNLSENAFTFTWEFEGPEPTDPPSFEGRNAANIVFPKPGDYVVRLTGVGEDGVTSETTEKTINIAIPILTAGFEVASDNQFLSPTTLTFDNTSVETIDEGEITYRWDFGIEVPAADSVAKNPPPITYLLDGLYDISLEICDANNCDTFTEQVEIVGALTKFIYWSDARTGLLSHARLRVDELTPRIRTGSVLAGSSVRDMQVYADAAANDEEFFLYVADNGPIFGFQATPADGALFRTNARTTEFEYVINFNGSASSADPRSLAVYNDSIYYNDRTHLINRTSIFDPINGLEPGYVNPNGGNLGNGEGFSIMSHVDIDITTGDIYWTKNGYINPNGIFKVGISGTSGYEVIISDLAVEAVRVDPIGEKIYFSVIEPILTDFNGDPHPTRPSTAVLPPTGTGLYMADIDGRNVTFIDGSETAIYGIAVDNAGGKVYWTYRDPEDEPSSPANSGIKRANLDGTEVEMYIPNSYPYALTIDDRLR